MFDCEYPISMIEQRAQYMFHSFYKLMLIFTMNLIISAPTYANVVEQKVLNFPVKPQALMKGDIHYYFTIMTPRQLASKQPELFELDSLSLLQESGVKIVVNKSVSIVNKPVGFFDDKQMVDEKFVSHVMGDQKVKKLGPDSFKVFVPGDASYKMQLFFDADDVSTLPNSKVIRAVTAAKKMDVISQSASTIMFTEKTLYTKYADGGVSVSSFIPMKENKTLVITYNMYALKAKFALEKVLKKSFLQEAEAVRDLQENYKEQ
jgi:hypothetical protein